VTAFFTADDGARIAFADEGAGTPLLCLNGLTHHMGDFDPLAGALGGVRLIRMDYRGRGSSDWTGAGTYTVPHEAADGLGLLDHLGLARAAILGTSRGGIVGMYIGATAPGRLAGLCLNDVGPVLEPEGLARIESYLGLAPELPDFAAAARRLAATPGFEGVPPARWQAEARRRFADGPDGRPALNYDPALRDAFLDAQRGGGGDLWALFDALPDIPLAAIRGANSALLSRATVAEMRRRRPAMITAEVPGRGHVPFLDEPEALEAVRTFIADVA